MEDVRHLTVFPDNTDEITIRRIRIVVRDPGGTAIADENLIIETFTNKNRDFHEKVVMTSKQLARLVVEMEARFSVEGWASRVDDER